MIQYKPVTKGFFMKIISLDRVLKLFKRRYVMKNKLIIGGIFCFVLLCMMPMISAVEIKTVEKAQDRKIMRQSEILLLKKVGDLFKKGVIPKHPILFIIVLMHVVFRSSRGYNLFDLSGEWEYNGRLPEFKVKHPLLFLRATWLISMAEFEFEFWAIVSDSLGWNWPYFN